jgi:hypothetical protein
MNVRRTIAIPVGAILIGACTLTTQNTARQDLIWSTYKECKADGRIPSSIQLDRVDLDGRVWYSSNRTAYGATELERCINEKVAPPPTYMPVVSGR